MMSTNISGLDGFRIGNSRNIQVTITNRITKAGIDITGDKIYFTVKDHSDEQDSDAAIQASVVASGDDATNGIAIIPVTSEMTAAVLAGTYYYDVVWLRLTSAPGQRLPVLDGTVSFSQAVTHALT
jgi:hypothetical protein